MKITKICRECGKAYETKEQGSIYCSRFCSRQNKKAFWSNCDLSEYYQLTNHRSPTDMIFDRDHEPTYNERLEIGFAMMEDNDV